MGSILTVPKKDFLFELERSTSAGGAITETLTSFERGVANNFAKGTMGLGGADLGAGIAMGLLGNGAPILVTMGLGGDLGAILAVVVGLVDDLGAILAVLVVGLGDLGTILVVVVGLVTGVAELASTDLPTLPIERVTTSRTGDL